jgi:hypothetical protein
MFKNLIIIMVTLLSININSKEINLFFIYDSSVTQLTKPNINGIINDKLVEINESLRHTGISEVKFVSVGYSKINPKLTPKSPELYTIDPISKPNASVANTVIGSKFKDIINSIEAKENGFENVILLKEILKADFYVYLTERFPIEYEVDNQGGYLIDSNDLTKYIPVLWRAGKVSEVLISETKGDISSYKDINLGLISEYSDSGAKTFSHEIGHLLGLLHDFEPDYHLGVYEDAKGFVTEENITYTDPKTGVKTIYNRGTIMTYELFKEKVFSNPNFINCGGNNLKDCGEFGVSNAVRTLQETIPQIINFRNRTDDDFF